VIQRKEFHKTKHSSHYNKVISQTIIRLQQLISLRY